MSSDVFLKMLNEGIKEIEPLEELGKSLARSDHQGKAMTTSQLRRFYGAMKRIEADFNRYKGEVILLEPKLAYAAGRSDERSKLREFYKVLSPLIRGVKEDGTRYTNFVLMVEAIVAYHKLAGGKDK